MSEIGVGLLGLGTVGGGVADLLRRNGDLLAARAGVRPVLRAIGVTVSLGVVSNFVLALLLTRPRREGAS